MQNLRKLGFAKLVLRLSRTDWDNSTARANSTSWADRICWAGYTNFDGFDSSSLNFGQEFASNIRK